MKKYILLLTIIAFTRLNAQIEFSLGKLSPEEINMKVCPFDKTASAVILMREGYCDNNERGNMITYTHIRIKVLTKDGIDNGTIKIPYIIEDSYEYIDDINALTINMEPDGSRNQFLIDKKSIYSKDITKKMAQVSFAFPQVKVGSVLDYSYRSVRRSFGSLTSWDFQDLLPVCYSSFELHPPSYLELSYSIQKSDLFKVDIKQGNDISKIHFEMKNIPGLSFEPYMDAREDYLQKVTFQLTKRIGEVGIENIMTSWKEVAKKLSINPWFGKEIGIRIKSAEESILPKCEGKTDEEKVKIIYDFVRSNMQWDGSTWFFSDGIKTGWDKKTANSGTINLILINLLKSAGLQVYPMLVSERGHGKIHKDKPYIYDFNNVYAAVVIGGQKYYLDATDRFTPYNQIPEKILNTTAYISDFNASELFLVEEPEKRYRENISIDETLDEDGALSGTVQMVSKDYARTERMRNYMLDKKAYIDNTIKAHLVNVNIDSLVVSNLDNADLPLVHNFNMSMNINETGEYKFVILNLFSGYGSNPFISDERFSNVNFGFKRTTNMNTMLTLSKTDKVDGIPKNITLVNSDKSVTFSRSATYDESAGTIAIRMKIEINKSIFTIEEYPELKEFFKKMVNLLNEPIVLKKL